MAQKLKNRVAVITGAGRGIGRGISLLMAREGAKVVVNDLGGATDGSGISQNPADEVVKEIKSKWGMAVANYDSVSTKQGGENIIKTAVDNFGRIDILVNNAGILRDRMIFNMSEEEWDAVIKVHLYGHFYCTRPASAYMRQQNWGRIINISSPAGLGNVGQANYSAAKEGIVGFTRTVARDLGRFGVTCNAVRPRAATRLTTSPDLEAVWKKIGKEAAYKKLTSLSPDDIAPFVVFLATEDAGNINGCVFLVAGGEIGIYETLPVPQRTIYKDGRWSLDELLGIVPSTLAAGLVNPAPPAPSTPQK
jgi:NAD(P)-dependent dehydrogenase (short-subunit alcohol dehydrogenase family)